MQRDILENIMCSTLPEDAWLLANLPVIQSWLVVIGHTDEVKAACDDCIRSVSSVSSQNADVQLPEVYLDLISSISHLVIKNYTKNKSQETKNAKIIKDLLFRQTHDREKNPFFVAVTSTRRSMACGNTCSLTRPSFATEWIWVKLEMPFRHSGLWLWRKCPYCKTRTLDLYGNHAVAWCSQKDGIARHHWIRGRLAAAFSFANLSPISEKENLIPESEIRPGENFIPSWTADKPAAFDVTITSQLQPTRVFSAAEMAGVTTKIAEERNFKTHNANLGVLSFFLTALSTNSRIWFSKGRTISVAIIVYIYDQGVCLNDFGWLKLTRFSYGSSIRRVQIGVLR